MCAYVSGRVHVRVFRTDNYIEVSYLILQSSCTVLISLGRFVYSCTVLISLGRFV